MMRTRRDSTYSLFFLLILVCVFFVLPLSIQAQQNIGGPYEPDSATVLLMHFDGDLENETDKTADAKGYGNYSFLEMRGAGDFNQQIRLDNDSPEDKSYFNIPDTAALDLTGSWTIEFWMLAWNFEVDRPWNADPWLVIKPAINDTSTFQLSPAANYSVRNFKDPRTWESGYHLSDKSQFLEISSSKNAFQTTIWYHVTFIRDTARKQLIQLIHQNATESRLPNKYNDPLELVDSSKMSIEEKVESRKPVTSGHPLFIGGFPQPDSTFGYFDGYIDELRISNTVRHRSIYTSIQESNLPKEITLKPNYPNPFNPSTNIRFSLPHSEQVTINVYNTLGQKIETVVNRQMTAGSHSVTFNAEGLPSSVYIYRLKAGEYRESRKMLLVK